MPQGKRFSTDLLERLVYQVDMLKSEASRTSLLTTSSPKASSTARAVGSECLGGSTTTRAHTVACDDGDLLFLREQCDLHPLRHDHEHIVALLCGRRTHPKDGVREGLLLSLRGVVQALCS